MSDRLAEMEKRFLQEIAEQRKDGDEKIDRTEGSFGEAMQSMRTHIHHIETWARDEFVRRTSFEQALTRIESKMDSSDKKIDALSDRIVAALNRAH